MTTAEWEFTRREIESKPSFRRLGKQQRRTILSALLNRANKAEVAVFLNRVGLAKEVELNSTTGETVVKLCF